MIEINDIRKYINIATSINEDKLLPEVKEKLENELDEIEHKYAGGRCNFISDIKSLVTYNEDVFIADIISHHKSAIEDQKVLEDPRIPYNERAEYREDALISEQQYLYHKGIFNEIFMPEADSITVDNLTNYLEYMSLIKENEELAVNAPSPIARNEARNEIALYDNTINRIGSNIESFMGRVYYRKLNKYARMSSEELMAYKESLMEKLSSSKSNDEESELKNSVINYDLKLIDSIIPPEYVPKH